MRTDGPHDPGRTDRRRLVVRSAVTGGLLLLATALTLGRSAPLARALPILAAIAITLAGLRLLSQLIGAHLDRRRARRDQRALEYLGPVSVIVPAHNDAATIADTVRALATGDYPWTEVVVVDDGSTDDTAGIAERLRLPTVHVLRRPGAGRAAALNAGIAYATAGLLVLVEGPAVVERAAVGRLIQPLRDPAVGAVAGTTRAADRRHPLDHVIAADLDHRLSAVTRCLPAVPGALAAFRREAIDEAGGVPGDTHAPNTDLTVAVLRAGWPITHEPTAIARTEAPTSRRELCRQRRGTLQVIWTHRRALIRRSPDGRRGLAQLLLFQLLLPLTAPMVDLYAIHGLIYLSSGRTAAVWAVFTAVEAASAAHARHLHHERRGPLWSLPLQPILHRQLTWLAALPLAASALLIRDPTPRPAPQATATTHAGCVHATFPLPPPAPHHHRTPAGPRWPIN